jgi:hypothetical protein
MTDPDPFDPLAYVAAAAPAMGIHLTQARQAEVAAAFALVMRIAAPALALSIDGADEPAPVFTA